MSLPLLLKTFFGEPWSHRSKVWTAELGPQSPVCSMFQPESPDSLPVPHLITLPLLVLSGRTSVKCQPLLNLAVPAPSASLLWSWEHSILSSPRDSWPLAAITRLYGMEWKGECIMGLCMWSFLCHSRPFFVISFLIVFQNSVQALLPEGGPHWCLAAHLWG